MARMKIPRMVRQYMYNKYEIDATKLWNLLNKFKKNPHLLDMKEIKMLNDFSEYYVAIDKQRKKLLTTASKFKLVHKLKGRNYVSKS